MRKALKAWKMVVVFKYPLLLMGLIFLLSSVSMNNGARTPEYLIRFDPAFQNLLHIPVYGFLCYLFLDALDRISVRRVSAVIIALTASFAYGCVDEVHQAFVPGRYGDTLDIALNFSGSVAGALAYCGIYCKGE